MSDGVDNQPGAGPFEGPPRDPDCIFCKIVAGELPSRKVYEDDHAIAFLDLQPWHRGHTLVVPRDHVESFVSGAPLLAELGPAIDACARLLVQRLNADGINLSSSAGPVAGQEVMHLHVHLVPRYADAPGLRNLIDPRPADPAELDAVLAQINGAP
ncbi:MAG TPA: HIT family protein [Microlunatus sp.]|nr:HIT family protein [Microlunatus sp.]